MGILVQLKSLPSQMVRLMLGSFLAQCIQIGAFPVLLSKHLIELKVEPNQIGYFGSISWVSVLLLGPLVPKIIKSLGSNCAIVLSVALGVFSLVCMMASQSLWAFFLAASAMGASLIIRWIVCDILVIEFAPEPMVGRNIGVHEALMGLGIAFGPLVLAFSTLAQAEAFAFAMIFLSGALLFLLKNPLENNPTQNAQSTPNEKPTGSFLTVFAALPLSFIAFFSAFGGGFVESATTSLLPLGLNPQQFDFSTAVLFISLFGVGGTLLQPLIGWLADLRGFFIAQTICVLFIASIGCTIVLLDPSIFWMTALVFVLGGAAGGLNTLAVIQLGKTLSSTLIPFAMTAVAMMYTTGSIIGPTVAGTAIDIYQYKGLFIVFVLISVIILVSLCIMNTKYSKIKSKALGSI
jgi:MFS family permease